MPPFDTEILVLSVADYRETSLLARAMTPDWGHVGLVARGARRSRSELAALVQPCHRLRAQLHRRAESGLATLAAAEALHLPRYTLEARAWAGLYAEILTLTHENDPHSRELYRQACAFFAQLEQAQPTGSCALAGLYELMRALGYLPDFAAPPDAGDIAVDLADGSLRAPGEIAAHNRFPLAPAALQALHDLLQGESHQVPRRHGPTLARLAVALFESQLERRLKSARFLEEIVLNR